jgi:hypothetical protein
MVYSVEADVRRRIETSLAPADITALIVESDAEIDRRLLNTRPANVVKTISVLLTCVQISAREPQSRSTDGITDTFLSPKDWRDLAEQQIERTGGSQIPFVVASGQIIIS